MGLKRVLKGIATGGMSALAKQKSGNRSQPQPGGTIGNLASGFRPPTPPGLPGTPPTPPGLPGMPVTPMPQIPDGRLTPPTMWGQPVAPGGGHTMPVGPGVSAPGSQPSPGNPPPPGFESWEAYYQSILPPGGTNLRPGAPPDPQQPGLRRQPQWGGRSSGAPPPAGPGFGLQPQVGLPRQPQPWGARTPPSSNSQYTLGDLAQAGQPPQYGRLPENGGGFL